MDRQLLKWLLNEAGDTQLLKWATDAQLKVSGFREITRKNIRMVRPRIVQAFLKPPNDAKLLKSLFQYVHHSYSEEELEKWRGRSLEELQSAVQNQEHPLLDLVLILLTAEEPEALERAEQLLRSQGLADEEQEEPEAVESQVPPVPGSADREAQLLQELNQMEAKWREMKELLDREREKNSRLQAALEEQINLRKGEMQEWKKEKKSYTEKLEQLQQQNQAYLQQIEEQEKLIQQLQHEVATLREQMEELSSSLGQAEPGREQGAEKRRVVLLGEWGNLQSHDLSQYELTQVPNSQIEDFLANGLEADEIWMLTFQIAQHKQRKVRQVYGTDNILSFHSLVELEEYINQR